MTTIQDYECELHGRVEVVCDGDVPDVTACPRCGGPAAWRVSAPAVQTPDTHRRALTGHVRDTNPWTSGFDRPEVG